MATGADLAVLGDPSCPWYAARAWSGLPNVSWCERTRCEWMMEPANTLSNVAYFWAAWLVYRQATSSRAAKAARNRQVARLAALIAVMGAMSMVYHATLSFASQVLDFVGMFLFTTQLVVINMQRLRWVPPRLADLFFAAGFAASMAVLAVMRARGLPYQSLVAWHVLMLLLTEVAALRDPVCRADEAGTSARPLVVGLALLAAAAYCSFLDVSRRWCWPDHPFAHGHAAWHLLSAGGVYHSYFYYRQFRLSLPTA